MNEAGEPVDASFEDVVDEAERAGAGDEDESITVEITVEEDKPEEGDTRE